MGSAAEAETLSTYVNAQEDVLIQMSTIKLNQSQTPTPIQVYKYIDVIFTNKIINPKLS